VVHDDRLETRRQMDLDRFAGGAERVGGSVDAPCCTAPPMPYFSRASFDNALSASRSMFTLAIEPSGSTTPP
jgi:hypothetical protein